MSAKTGAPWTAWGAKCSERASAPGVGWKMFASQYDAASGPPGARPMAWKFQPSAQQVKSGSSRSPGTSRAARGATGQVRTTARTA